MHGHYKLSCAVWIVQPSNKGAWMLYQCESKVQMTEKISRF